MREGIYFNVYDAVHVTCMVSPTVYNWVLFTIFVLKTAIVDCLCSRIKSYSRYQQVDLKYHPLDGVQNVWLKCTIIFFFFLLEKQQ